MDPNLTSPNQPVKTPDPNPAAAGPTPPAPSNQPQPGISSNPSLPWVANNPQPAIQNPSYPPPLSIPSASTVINQPTGSPPPPVEESPVTIMPVQPKKFPGLLITSLVLLVITGFSGSYIYFQTTGQAKQKQNIVPKITPPVTEAFIKDASASSGMTNPFDSDTYENPFSNQASYQNPFGDGENESTNSSYQNPFGEITPTP